MMLPPPWRLKPWKGRLMMYWDKYYQARSAAEAIGLLARYKGEARLIAGGTDLIIQLREGTKWTRVLIDISCIRELQYIEEDNGKIKIGALTTHSQLATSPLLWKRARVLAQAAASVGSPQIRNIGTVGGNVVNAQPAADTTVALMALEGKVTIINSEGERELPLADLFAGVGKSKIDATREMVKEFSFDVAPDTLATSFGRVARRNALALPVLNVGVSVAYDESTCKLKNACICVAPVAPIPLRMTEAEEILISAPINEHNLREASEAAVRAAKPRDSRLRGSALYRLELVRVMTYRTLKDALQTLEGCLSA